jgi:predicted nucleic-acid-binding protein
VIGLDTNVLVRYIAQDDVIQSALAVKLIEKQCSADQPGFVGLVSLVELVWVSESCYGATKKDVVELVRRLLSTKQLLVQDAETVWKALLMFEAGQADFADYLVERVARAAGCASIVTFDKKAAKAGMTLLK